MSTVNYFCDFINLLKFAYTQVSVHPLYWLRYVLKCNSCAFLMASLLTDGAGPNGSSIPSYSLSTPFGISPLGTVSPRSLKVKHEN